MSAFSPDWLRLREPSDHLAREAAATAAAAMHHRWYGALRGAESSSPVAHGVQAWQVMDLGCGTGATLRYLAPRLGGAQHWQVWDDDEALLRAWPATMTDWARREGHDLDSRGGMLRIEGRGFSATVERHRADLSHRLDTLPFADTDLVCATALIDLVSRTWLADLIGRARRTRARLSLALMVDGRLEWDPAQSDDAEVAQSFARHQGRDKGFGPALGAGAPEAAGQLLAQAGYTVELARSDWVLKGGPLLAAMIEGLAAAAVEQDPGSVAVATRWRRQRAAAVEASCLRVGHVDIVAVPPMHR